MHQTIREPSAACILNIREIIRARINNNIVQAIGAASATASWDAPPAFALQALNGQQSAEVIRPASQA